MTGDATHMHGTAIVIGGIGLLFVGPSGSGKSATAFDCLAEAGLRGLSHALLADDQVLLQARNGKVFGQRPQAIKGLIELRYSGIVMVESVEEAELHYAVMLINADETLRLPPEDERIRLAYETDLPVIRVPFWSRFPLALILAQIARMQANTP